jgi:hypothetical protein
MQERDADRLTPDPVCPFPINLNDKRDIEKNMVKLPDGTNFQMSAFGQGKNDEYLLQVIMVKHPLEQKGTFEVAMKAFDVALAVKKLWNPFVQSPWMV